MHIYIYIADNHIFVAVLNYVFTAFIRSMFSFEKIVDGLYIILVFNQGDEGASWYIILKGAIDIVIHGKVFYYLKRI